MMRALILFFSLSLLIPQAFAHKPSDSYLFLNVNQHEVLGQWDIALRDLDFAIGLDANGDGNITWGELRAKHGEIAAYALAHFKLAADGVDCLLRATDQLVDNHSDGAYAVLKFSATCKPSPETLTASYTLFSTSIRSTRDCCALNTTVRLQRPFLARINPVNNSSWLV